MDLGSPDGSIRQSHTCYAFKFSPAARTELAPEPHDVSYPAADGYRFDFLDLADNLEIHESILTSVVGPSLQHPLRRQHFPGQPLFQHCGLIKCLRERLENGFHDVVGIAAIHEIHVQIEPAVGHKGLKEILKKP